MRDSVLWTIPALALALVLPACGLPKVSSDSPGSTKASVSDYCSKIVNKGNKASKAHYGVGGALAILATAGVITGGAMGPSMADDANWADENRNALLIGSSAIIGALSGFFIARGAAIAESSETALQGVHAAEGGSDEAIVDARSKCTTAHANWMVSRAKAMNAMQAELEKETNRARKAEDEVEEVKAEKEEAETAAEEARTRLEETTNEAETELEKKDEEIEELREHMKGLRLELPPRDPTPPPT